MTKISDIGSVRTVVKTALQKGIQDVVLSPGSRNAPFILSFAALDVFRCHSVLDERSAAFMALGMAQQTRKPVILSCTSGSAVLNYAPALAEAYYQRIPVIAVTADRPKEWIDQGEGQSLRQHIVLDGVVVQSFHLCKEHSEDDAWYNRRLVNEAFETAMRDSRPVQINVPLSEPLYGIETFEPTESSNELRIFNGQPRLSPAEADQLAATWSESKQILILATQMATDPALLEQLKSLGNDSRIAVVTETTANFYQFGFVCCIDRTIETFLGTDRESQFIPDLLITLGENIISKKFKALLRTHKAHVRQHWHFGREVMDTFQSLTHLIAAAPAHVLNEVKSETPDRPSEFGARWKSAFFKAEQQHHSFLETAPYSDLKVFETVLDFVPDGWQMQMGNSSVVRYIQLFNQLGGVSYFGNRGVSGIEGSTSTALGAAIASDHPVLLVSGDHAFRYDANGMSHRPLPNNLRIIVINNGGGNIFRIIDGPQQHALSEAYIEKTDEESVEALVKLHQADYLKATNLVEVAAAMEKMVGPETNKCTVLEVFTPRKESPEILKQYFKYLKDGNA